MAIKDNDIIIMERRERGVAMAKTRQIMSFCDYGQQYKVIRKYGDNNPYKIYSIYNAPNKNGVVTSHRKLMVAYEDLQSCFYWFIQNHIGS